MVSSRQARTAISQAVKILKAGRTVVFPTDTSYGLAVDALNPKAIRKLYKIKQRKLVVPIHVVVASLKQAKKIAQFNQAAEKLFKQFLPGKLTLVLPLRSKNAGLKMLAAGTGTIGIRMPNNKLALRLVKKLGRPITATSANPPDRLGGYDAYSVSEVQKQFKNMKFRPDFYLDGGKLKKTKPSTVLSLVGHAKILRAGPVSETQIKRVIK